MKSFIVSGRMVFVDDEDFDRVTAYSWYVDKRTEYIVHKVYNEYWLLHRFILNYEGPLVVDHHPDKDPGNCQKSNLRIVECWQNNLPKPGDVFRHNTSSVNGVHLVKATGKYEVYVSINNKKRYLGVFDSLEDAKKERVSFDSAVAKDPSIRVFSDKRRNNTSGVVGVSFASRTGKWKAKLGSKHLGFFDSFEKAVEARKNAETNWAMDERSKVGSI